MQTKPLRPADEKIFREGLTSSQQENFDGWSLYVEKWVENGYKSGEILDYQSAMSEALLALRRAVASYNSRGKFKPFLDTCLKNAMEDMRLRESRRRQISIDSLPTPKGGIDRDDVQTLDEDEFRSLEDSRIIHRRPRRPRRRYWGGLTPVLAEVYRREAAEAYARGLKDGWKSAWREALVVFGKTECEIEALIAEEEEQQRKEAKRAANPEWRAKRNAQQRARRLRQRQLAKLA